MKGDIIATIDTAETLGGRLCMLKCLCIEYGPVGCARAVHPVCRRLYIAQIARNLFGIPYFIPAAQSRRPSKIGATMFLYILAPKAGTYSNPFGS